MPEAIKMTGGLYRDSLADNPYADETMWKLENAIIDATEKINAEVAQLDDILRNIPSVITIKDVLSRSPVNIGVFSRSPLGYRCVWLLVGYDQLALKTFQAAHLGLISRNQRDELLSFGAYLIRKIYGILQIYRSVGVTRDDIENKTSKGEKA
ncbi:PFL_4669 family integrating conjugative element protein, partial [Escherichia coli]